MAKQPILDLDTLVERAPVRIDGQLYEMLNPAELSILDLHRFGAAGAELANLREIGADPTDEQMNAVSETLRRMVRMILRAPDEVLDRLTDVHRFRVVQAFNGLTLSGPADGVSEPEAVAAQPSQPTSEKS
jgi:hypothetical protein